MRGQHGACTQRDGRRQLTVRHRYGKSQGSDTDAINLSPGLMLRCPSAHLIYRSRAEARNRSRPPNYVRSNWTIWTGSDFRPNDCGACSSLAKGGKALAKGLSSMGSDLDRSSSRGREWFLGTKTSLTAVKRMRMACANGIAHQPRRHPSITQR